MKPLFLLVLFCFSVNVSGQSVRNFIFGHSLIHHEIEVDPPVPSQETSVPHWLYLLADHAGKDYAVSGQYGFLPQHRNVPPIAQWGFDIVPFVWDSDNEPFSAADFTHIMITPGNFIQWQPPTEHYFNEDFSPIDATIDIINWCLEQEPGMDIYLYENWPDMASYLGGGFPPSPSEWQSYNDYLLGDFHDWNIDYRNAVQAAFADDCVKMIPVGPAIADVLQSTPFDAIPIEELYEDDAPHGRPTLYFLAAIATYMAFYEERPPLDFELEQIIHHIVRDNYALAVDIIWQRLLAEGEVFCSLQTSTKSLDNIDPYIQRSGRDVIISILPADASHVLLSTVDGRQVSKTAVTSNKATISIDNQIGGVGILSIYDKDGNILISEKILL